MTETETIEVVEQLRGQWSQARVSLLVCHLQHAIDETSDLGGKGELEDMKEAESMLINLVAHLNRLLPQQRVRYKEIRNGPSKG